MSVGSVTTLSVVATLPASGQQVMANSVGVVIASDQSTIPVSVSGVSTAANQSTELTRIGDVTEAAPGTDTASSGLNGRLQRIAQRITSLISLIPAALTGSGNFKVAVVESTATQAVSAASLPLPTGAATSANQTNGTQKTQLTDALGQSILGTLFGQLRVIGEASAIFHDPFDGTVIDTQNWSAAVTATGGTVTQGSSAINIATTTAANSAAAISSIASFNTAGVNQIIVAAAIQMEVTTLITGVHRFFGIAEPGTAYSSANPIKNGIGFEMTTGGQMRAVIYSADAVVYSSNITTPTDGLYHSYSVTYRADTTLFAYDGVVVASTTYTSPVTSTQPIRLHMINGGSVLSGTPTWKVGALGIGDSGQNGSSITDGVYKFRKATVKAASTPATAADTALVVTDLRLPTALGQAVAASSLPVTLSTEDVQDVFVTGQGAQSAAGNNVLLAVAGTSSVDTLPSTGESYRSFFCQVIGSAGIASGAITFEGSNDNTTFVTIPVYDDAVITGTQTQAAITIAASTNRFFSGRIPYRYFRCRISTVFAGGTIQALVRYSKLAYIPGVVTVGNPTAANLLGNITTCSTVTTLTQLGGASVAAADGKANPTTAMVVNGNMRFNGTTWDRQYANYNTTTGDTGAKTASFVGATQTNWNSKAAYITVLCGTVSGTTPTMTAQLQYSPDAGTTWINVGPASGTVTATGNTILFVVSPSNTSQAAGGTPANLTTGATQTVVLNTFLPRTWRLNYTITGTTPSFAITATYVNYAND